MRSTVYGEGAYPCAACGIVHPPVRGPAQLDAAHLDAGRWEPPCPRCSGPLLAVPTPETLTPDPGLIYGVTKLAQEQLRLCTGRAYGIGVTVLRFFNVYGPRQSRSNPYTGIITAFLNRLAAGEAPEVYEDGLMTRDFVHVSDIVAALVAAEAAAPRAAGIFNIGSGQATSIVELAALLCRSTASGLAPQISGARGRHPPLHRGQRRGGRGVRLRAGRPPGRGAGAADRGQRRGSSCGRPDGCAARAGAGWAAALMNVFRTTSYGSCLSRPWQSIMARVSKANTGERWR